MESLPVLTLVTVCPSESLLTLAAELSTSVTPTPPVGTAHIGRNQTHPTRCAIGRHCHRAAVNHWKQGGAKGPGMNRDCRWVYTFKKITLCVKWVNGNLCRAWCGSGPSGVSSFCLRSLQDIYRRSRLPGWNTDRRFDTDHGGSNRCPTVARKH